MNDCALVAMLVLLGLPLFETTGAGITALSQARGHRVLIDRLRRGPDPVLKTGRLHRFQQLE